MTRLEHEEVILLALRAQLPTEVDVAPMPLGVNDRLLYDIRKWAVWVVYVGGAPAGGQPEIDCKTENWTWQMWCMAKEYRSSRDAAESALGLLEQVNAAMQSISIQGRRFARAGDKILQLEPGVGVMGYETTHIIKAFLKR